MPKGKIKITERAYTHLAHKERLMVVCEQLGNIIPSMSEVIDEEKFMPIYRQFVEWRDAHFETIDSSE